MTKLPKAPVGLALRSYTNITNKTQRWAGTLTLHKIHDIVIQMNHVKVIIKQKPQVQSNLASYMLLVNQSLKKIRKYLKHSNTLQYCKSKD